jgi:hypothetical protein
LSCLSRSKTLPDYSDRITSYKSPSHSSAIIPPRRSPRFISRPPSPLLASSPNLPPLPSRSPSPMSEGTRTPPAIPAQPAPDFTAEDFQRLQAEMLNLQNLIAQFQAAQPPLPLPAVAPVLPTIKINKPIVFDGTASEVLDFLHQCNLYIAAQPDALSEKSKILFALSYMTKGSAKTWGKQRLARYERVTHWVGATWHDFETEVRVAFGDIDHGVVARTELEKIKQGSLTADAYNVEFNKWRFDSGYNDEALINYYKKGLNVPLLKEVYRILPIPRTIIDWQTNTSQADRRWRELQAFHSSTSSSTSKRKDKPSSSSSSSSKPSTSSSSSSKATSSSSRTTATVVSSAPDKIKQEAVDPVIAA